MNETISTNDTELPQESYTMNFQKHKKIYKKNKWELDYQFIILVEHLSNKPDIIDEKFAKGTQMLVDIYNGQLEKVDEYQKQKNLEPNYKTLNKIVSYVIERAKIFREILFNDKSTPNMLMGATLIFISRVEVMSRIMFQAGVTDKNDQFCQKFVSEDWKLINESTIEIMPDTKENLLKRLKDYDQLWKSILVAICKNLNVSPKSEKDYTKMFKEYIVKILEKKTDHDQPIDKDAVKHFPKIGPMIINEQSKSKKEINKEKTQLDFELVIAAPSYKILGNLAYMSSKICSNNGNLKTQIKDGIATNFRVFLRPNVMQTILRQDPYEPEKRPVVLHKANKLVIDACELLPPDILSKRNNTIAIRIVNFFKHIFQKFIQKLLFNIFSFHKHFE